MKVYVSGICLVFYGGETRVSNLCSLKGASAIEAIVLIMDLIMTRYHVT